MRSTRLLLAVLLTACGVETAEAPEPQKPAPQKPAPEKVELRLETREGESALGYSFMTRTRMPLGESDLHVSAFDCGARGRWVDLVGTRGIAFCATLERESCSNRLSVGGTDEAFSGERWVKRGDEVIGRLKLLAHSPTPTGWEQQSPFPAYDVTLEVIAETPAAPR